MNGIGPKSITAFSDRLLSKNARNLKRIVLILSSTSLFLYLGMDLLKDLNKHLNLPFGWEIRIARGEKTFSDRIHSLGKNVSQNRIFSKLKPVDPIESVSFKTLVYSKSSRNYRFFISDPGKGKIFCNRKPGFITKDQRRNKILLREGVNEIEIRYGRRADWPKNFRFFLRFFKKAGVASSPLPFYHYILPGRGSGKIWFHILNFTDLNVKHIGFTLALFLLIFLFPRAISTKKPSLRAIHLKSTLANLLVEYLLLLPAMILAFTFLNNRLLLKLSNPFIWLLSIGIATGNLISSAVKPGSLKKETGKIIVLMLIAGLVFGFIHQVSGTFFPLHPIGEGDLERHMQMVYHYQYFNGIRTDQVWKIYPQSVHALLATVSDLLRVPPESVITLFMAGIFIMIYLLVFMLIKHFFPNSRAAFFFPVTLWAGFGYILGSVFHQYFFPPIVSICFFLGALYFLLNERRASSSIMLAVSLIVYPYFMAVFLIASLFLWTNRLLTLPGKRNLGMIICSLIYFALPFLFSYVYGLAYISFGYSQQARGFDTFYMLNPFTALGSLNSFAILIGLAFMFSEPRKNRTVMILMFSLLTGFLFYYIANIFGFGSTYYLTKLMIVLMLCGIIPEVHALDNLYLKLKHSKLFKFGGKNKLQRTRKTE